MPSGMTAHFDVEVGRPRGYRQGDPVLEELQWPASPAAPFGRARVAMDFPQDMGLGQYFLDQVVAAGPQRAAKCLERPIQTCKLGRGHSCAQQSRLTRAAIDHDQPVVQGRRQGIQGFGSCGQYRQPGWHLVEL